MAEHHDSTTSVEGYLAFLCANAGGGLETITDQDIGAAVLEPNFRSQLVAVRSVHVRERPTGRSGRRRLGRHVSRSPSTGRSSSCDPSTKARLRE